MNSIILPKPKNWQEFEDIVLASYRLAWSSPQLTKNGRAGQRQAGVDIYGADEIGRRVGIQCKRYASISLALVEAEIKNAERFVGTLSTLYVATTAEHDAKLQQEVRILSDERVAKGLFAVGVLFWEDVQAGLFLNPAILRSFYPQIALPADARSDRTRLLAALELGFYGPYIWNYVLLTFGEVGEMAHTDEDLVVVTLRIVEVRASQLLAPVDAQPILDSVARIRLGTYVSERRKADWTQVELHARRVATRLGSASSLLEMTEGSMLDAGIALGRVEHDTGSNPSSTFAANLKRTLKALLPDTSGAAIDARFRAARKTDAGYRWANIIRSATEREIRHGDW